MEQPNTEDNAVVQKKHWPNGASIDSADRRVATYQAEVAFSTEPHDVTIAGLGYTFIHVIREPFGVPDPQSLLQDRSADWVP